MKRKVTLKELVGTKIILALLLVFYYWMFARTDWKSYYDTIQYCVMLATVVFFLGLARRTHLYSKEEKDELAMINLKRVDSIAMKIFLVTTILSAFASVLQIVDNRGVGYLLVGSVVLVTIVRFIVFCIMDTKGV